MVLKFDLELERFCNWLQGHSNLFISDTYSRFISPSKYFSTKFVMFLYPDNLGFTAVVHCHM